MQPVFRFAPTPNGRLHRGHAYSALLNQRMAQEMGGRLLLRIEDTDQTRCKPEFVQGIFEDMQWLGISYETPVRIQSQHMDEYRTALDRLWEMDAIYPCFCSRKLAAAEAKTTRDPDGQAHYGGRCRSLGRETAKQFLQSGAQAGWRLKTDGPWGDVVIAKFEVGSSYHIAVVVDDALQGVTHVVRGRDLEAATVIHTQLQELLGLPTPQYHHHRFIADVDGVKLSKSLGSQSLDALRRQGVSVHDVRKALGFR